LIGVGLLLFLIYWLAVKFIIPFLVLNLSIIFLLFAIYKRERRLVFSVLSVIGGVYTFLDIRNEWLTDQFIRLIVSNRRYLDLIVYANSIAVFVCGWFLVDPFRKRIDDSAVYGNTAKVFLKTGLIAFVSTVSLVIPYLYNAEISILKPIIIDYSSKSVKIGSQVWMSENLDVTRFRNGDSIPFVDSNEEWELAGKEKRPCWGFPESDMAYMGRLYNYYAVSDPRGLAPEGWHVPSDDEWQELVTSLGGYKKAGKAMKAPTEWAVEKRKSKKGSNTSGFSALPSGNRNSDGEPINAFVNCFFWSTSESTEGTVWIYKLSYNVDALVRQNMNKRVGFSVRCLKDVE
jgi:uncharacterized protein (TIGR02145 family)